MRHGQRGRPVAGTFIEQHTASVDEAVTDEPVLSASVDEAIADLDLDPLDDGLLENLALAGL